MIRKKVSRVLNFGIPEGKWVESFHKLETDGRITKKHITSILLIILETLEDMEPKKSV